MDTDKISVDGTAPDSDAKQTLNKTSGNADTQKRLLQIGLWFIPAMAAIALCRKAITFADLGWQLQLGRLMAAEGPFLHERFLASHLGEALLPNAWLAQMLYAGVFDWTGLRGLRAVDGLLWISGPLLATIPVRLRVAKPIPVLYALAIGFAVALPSSSIRPQSFASLGFGLALVLIHEVRSWRTGLLLGLPLFVIWQNLHPSVPVAALIIGAIAAVQWGQFLVGKAARPVALTVLAIAAGLAVFATPAGTAIVTFARYNATASIAFGATEWFPLWHPYHRAAFFSVLASAAVVLFVAVQQRKVVPVCELVPALITFALAMTAARFVLFYAIAIVPLLTRLDIGSGPAIRAGLRKILADSAVAALLVVLVCVFRPQTGNDRQVAVALIQRLHQGTVFCDPALGGAIILDGYPNWQVSFDGRYFLYPRSEIALLSRAASDGGVVADIERTYHPAAYALNASRSAALVQELAAHPEIWRRIYDNGESVLFVRIPPLAAR